MKEKWNSLRFRVLFSCAISAFTIILVFLIYGGYTVVRYRDDFIGTNRIIVDFLADEFNYDIESLNEYISNLMAADNSYSQLIRSGLSEKNRIHAEYYLKNTMRSRANALERKGGIFYL